jgi:hypothetical protein
MIFIRIQYPKYSNKWNFFFEWHTWMFMFNTQKSHISQIYRLHGFIPNLCKIYYFIGSHCLNMMSCANNTTFVSKQYREAIKFMSKQCTWHWYSNNIQINEWHPCLFHINLWKVDFAQLLLLNRDLWSL